MSADYFQNRANGYEQTRRGPDAPRERERPRASDTGSQAVIRPQIEVLPPETITWGTTIKISMAIYFALLGVVITLTLAGLLFVRFAWSAVDDLRYGLGETSVSVHAGTVTG